MTLREKTVGILEGTPRDTSRVLLIKHLAEEIPLFWTAVKGMKKAGIRTSGETDPSIPTPERSFKLASEHSIVVALVVRELADMVGLSTSDKRLLVTAALIHDATKKIEISMMDYPKVTKEKDLYKKELEHLVDEIDLGYSKEQIDTIVTDLGDKNAFEASQYFDEMINTPFLEKTFSESTVQLDRKVKEKLITVASSDSFAAIPRNIARTARLVEDSAHASEATSIFLNHVNRMQQERTFPEIQKSDTDLLSLMLTYADGLAGTTKIEVNGENKITTSLKNLTDRRAESINNKSYQKLEEESPPYFGGNTLLTVSYSMQDVIQELLFKKITIEQPTLKTPNDLPRFILNRIQNRVKTN